MKVIMLAQSIRIKYIVSVLNNTFSPDRWGRVFCVYINKNIQYQKTT